MKLVSACLVGINCRYAGKNKLDERLVKLYERAELIPVCPEQLGGLPTPRAQAEPTADGWYVLSGDAKVITKCGRDVTEYFVRCAEKTLGLAKLLNIEEAIFKARSPSCGCGRIYDGTFSGKLTDGDGITTALLKKNGISAVTEEEFKKYL